MSRFLLGITGTFLPEQVAIGPVEAHQRATAVNCLRKEYPVAPNDGCRVSGFGQRRAPKDVLVGAPVQWEVLFKRNAGA